MIQEDQEIQNEEVDIEKLMAEINANFDENEDDKEQQQQQSQQQQQQSQSQDNENLEQIVVVREQAIEKKEEIDSILEIVNKIEIQPSLLTNKDIGQYQIDTSPLQELLFEIKTEFDKKEQQIIQKQKHIFNNVLEIRNLSTQLIHLQQQQIGLSKLKENELQQKHKELQQFEIQTSKSKGYVMCIIERLEIIETKLDKMIDAHVKKKIQELSN